MAGLDHLGPFIAEAAKMGDKTKGKHIAALFGVTGCGKTTLTYMLMNHDFKLLTSEMGMVKQPVPKAQIPDLNVSDKPEAGTTAVTIKPLEKDQPDGLYVCDLPGQNDASGLLNEIRFAVMTARALRQAASVRIVSCWPKNVLEAMRGGRIAMELLTDLHRMFQSWDEVKDKICFCFSKFLESKEMEDRLSYNDHITRVFACIDSLHGKRSCDHEGQICLAVLEQMRTALEDAVIVARELEPNEFDQVTIEATRAFVSNPMDSNLFPFFQKVVQRLPIVSNDSITLKLSIDGTATLLEYLRKCSEEAVNCFDSGAMASAASSFSSVVDIAAIVEQEQLVPANDLHSVTSQLIDSLESKNTAFTHGLLELITSLATRDASRDLSEKMKRMREMDDFVEKVQGGGAQRRGVFSQWSRTADVMARVVVQMRDDLDVVTAPDWNLDDLPGLHRVATKWSRVASALSEFDTGSMAQAVNDYLMTVIDRVGDRCRGLMLVTPSDAGVLHGASAVAQLAPIVQATRRMVRDCREMGLDEALEKVQQSLRTRTRSQLELLQKQCEDALSGRSLVTQGDAEREAVARNLQRISELCASEVVQEWLGRSSKELKEEFTESLTKIAKDVADGDCADDDDGTDVAEQLRKLILFETYVRSGNRELQALFENRKKEVAGQLKADLRAAGEELKRQIESKYNTFRDLAEKGSNGLKREDSFTLPEFELEQRNRIEWMSILRFAPTDAVLRRGACLKVVQELTDFCQSMLRDAIKYVECAVEGLRWTNVVAVVNNVRQGVLASSVDLDCFDLGGKLRDLCDKHNKLLKESEERLRSVLRGSFQHVDPERLVVDGSGEWIDEAERLFKCLSQLKRISFLSEECTAKRQALDRRVDAWVTALQNRMHETLSRLQNGAVPVAEIPALVNEMCDLVLSCAVPFESRLVRNDRTGSLRAQFDSFLSNFVAQLESPVNQFHDRGSREREYELLMTLFQRLNDPKLIEEPLKVRLSAIWAKQLSREYDDYGAFCTYLETLQFEEAMKQYSLKLTSTIAVDAFRSLVTKMEAFLGDLQRSALLGGCTTIHPSTSEAAKALVEIKRLVDNHEALRAEKALKDKVVLTLKRIGERAKAAEHQLKAALKVPHAADDVVDEFSQATELARNVWHADATIHVPTATKVVDEVVQPVLETSVVPAQPHRVLLTAKQQQDARAWAEKAFGHLENVTDAIKSLQAWQPLLEDQLRLSSAVIPRHMQGLKARAQKLSEELSQYATRDYPALGEACLERLIKVLEEANLPNDCLTRGRTFMANTKRLLRNEIEKSIQASKFKQALEKLTALPEEVQVEMVELIGRKVDSLVGPVDPSSADLLQRYCELQRFVEEAQGSQRNDLLRPWLGPAQDRLNELGGICDGKKAELLAGTLSKLGKRDIPNSARAMKVLLPFLKTDRFNPSEKDQLMRALEEFWRNLRDHATLCVTHVKDRKMKQLQLGQFAARVQDLENLPKDEFQALSIGVQDTELSVLLHDLVDELNREALNQTYISTQLEHRLVRTAVEAVALGLEAHCSFNGAPNAALQPSCEGVLDDFIERQRVRLSSAWDQRNHHRDGWSTVDAALETLRTIAKDASEYASLGAATRAAKSTVEEFEERMRQLVLAELRELNGATSAVKIGGPLVAAWSLSNHGATMQQIVTDEVGKNLRTLKATVGQRVVDEVGLNLQCGADEAGLELVDTFKDYFKGAAGALFAERLKAGQLGAKEVCNAMLQIDVATGTPSAIGSEKSTILQERLAKHAGTVSTLMRRFLHASHRNPQQAVDDACTHCYKTLRDFNASPTKVGALADLLTAVIVVYMVRFSVSAGYMEAAEGEEHNHLRQPHNVQTAGLMLLLELDRKSPGPFGRLLNAAKEIITGQRREGTFSCNKLVQVSTGEGKSIVLGILAALLGLQGFAVDVVCYSPYLSKRDYEDLRPLFDCFRYPDSAGFPTSEALDIQYGTFDTLCKREIGHHQTSLQRLLHDPKTIPVRPEAKGRPRMLLLDEVDVFLTRRFLGNTYNTVVRLKSAAIAKLVRLIWRKQKEGISAYNIEEEAAYKAVLDSQPKELHHIIKHCVLRMLANVQDFATPRFRESPDKAAIEYKQGDTFTSSIIFSNRTCFAYLYQSEQPETKITPAIADANLFIDIECGKFSYTSTVNPARYSAILGTTGTLQQLSAQERALVSSEFGVKEMIVLPSVYGTSNLKFKFSEDVEVVAKESDWILKIAQIAKNTSEAEESVLVYFKNMAKLEQFRREAGGFGDYPTLCEETPDGDKRGNVGRAVKKGMIILCTRAYGRGVDFLNRGTHLVVVLQTFYSTSEAEEVQIKGRTARQRQEGKYRMILCAEHLSKPKSFALDPAAVLNTPRDQLEGLLKKAREERLARKSADRVTRLAAAKQLDAESESFVSKVYDPKLKFADKVAALEMVVMNKMARPRRLIFVLDVSGSMSSALDDQSRWTHLCNAMNRVRESLQQQDAVVRAKTMTTVFFMHTVLVTPAYYDGEATGMKELPTQCPGGGNDFKKVFSQLDTHLQNPDQIGADFQLLFLTGGESNNPCVEVKAMLEHNPGRITKFFCLNFGKGDMPVLEAICNEFQQRKIETQLCDPKGGLELTAVMTEFASRAGS